MNVKPINNEVLIGAAIVFKDSKKKKLFLLAKDDEGKFELPKTVVRRGESSARAVIRYTSEQGNMSARILEEAGRATGSATINGKVISQRYYYYLLYYKSGAEVTGLGDVSWYDYSQSVKKLTLKRELDAFKNAQGQIKEWEKTKKKKQEEAEEEMFPLEA
jgi:ADP-ribose pyrophosphatase YjhB (NUDIX family)